MHERWWKWVVHMCRMVSNQHDGSMSDCVITGREKEGAVAKRSSIYKEYSDIQESTIERSFQKRLTMMSDTGIGARQSYRPVIQR